MSMNARLLSLILLAAGGVCSVHATAQTPGKVTEFGIYSDDHQLLKRTTTIPDGGAIRFGFCFEAFVDFYESEYMLMESLTHPQVPGQQGGVNTGYSVPRLFKVSRDGVASGCAGYRARDANDLRPGVWKFTISDGADELVVQEFTIK